RLAVLAEHVVLWVDDDQRRIRLLNLHDLPPSRWFPAAARVPGTGGPSLRATDEKRSHTSVCTSWCGVCGDGQLRAASALHEAAACDTRSCSCSPAAWSATT